jgi:hypothetical protein
LRAYLTDDAFTFDTYKGAPGNFRPWDNHRPRPAGNGLPLRVMPEVMRQEAESVFCLSVAKLPV